MWFICSIIFTDRKTNSANKMTSNIPHWIWVRFLSIISGHLRTLSASKKRRYICNVFSHWLTVLTWPKNSHNSHPSIFFLQTPTVASRVSWTASWALRIPATSRARRIATCTRTSSSHWRRHERRDVIAIAIQPFCGLVTRSRYNPTLRQDLDPKPLLVPVSFWQGHICISWECHMPCGIVSQKTQTNQPNQPDVCILKL